MVGADILAQATVVAKVYLKIVLGRPLCSVMSLSYPILRQNLKLKIRIWWYCLFVCLAVNGTFSTNTLYRVIEVKSISRRAGDNTKISCN